MSKLQPYSYIYYINEYSIPLFKSEIISKPGDKDMGNLLLWQECLNLQAHVYLFLSAHQT